MLGLSRQTFDGLPEINKKLARLSAARAVLNELIISGAIAAPRGCFNPGDKISDGPSDNVFYEIKRQTYQALEEVVKPYRLVNMYYFKALKAGNPLLSFCDSNTSSCFIFDAVSSMATLVSWACGKNANPASEGSSEEEIIDNIDTEELCRRGLLRFLCSQAKACGLTHGGARVYSATGTSDTNGTGVDGPADVGSSNVDDNGEEELSAKDRPCSIFTMREGEQRLSLRANLSLHFFHSDGPSGENTGNNFMKRSLLGVQGSLLNVLIRPIYAETISGGPNIEVLSQMTTKVDSPIFESEEFGLHLPKLTFLEVS